VDVRTAVLRACSRGRPGRLPSVVGDSLALCPDAHHRHDGNWRERAGRCRELSARRLLDTTASISVRRGQTEPTRGSSTPEARPCHTPSNCGTRRSGSAAIWVLLDLVTGSSRNQSIEMRWRQPGASDISDSKAVFKRADGFVGAWHLGEDGNTTPDGYKDSSEHTKRTGREWG